MVSSAMGLGGNLGDFGSPEEKHHPYWESGGDELENIDCGDHFLGNGAMMEWVRGCFNPCSSLLN